MIEQQIQTKIIKVTQEELFDILEKNIEGVFYYVNHLERYYCYLILKEKKTSNIWNDKNFAFNWMESVLQTNFKKTNQ